MAAKKKKKAARKKSSSRKASTSKPRKKANSSSQEVERLESLLKLMQQHDLVQLEIGPDGHSLKLSKQGAVAPAALAMPAAPAMAAAPAPAAPAADGGAPADAGGEAADPNVEPFLSPMVGTFYRAASPEAAPYVSAGDEIQPGARLCIIEAMKVFNEIKAETSGKVVEILVENGEAVEYGQPLLMIRKS